jgi:N-acetylmuramoyl-L-alanine amidase
MFKIAIDAGHYLKTAGKRIPKELDEKQTREWVLNNRLAGYLQEALQAYEDVSVLRTDDPTGEKSTSLQTRCDRANDFGADFFLSVHHNAGIGGGTGGGMVAYSYKGSKRNSWQYRDAIYDACIAAGGLKGNRATPKNTATFHVLKYSEMPAVLMEYGFMDSKTDAPVILTDSYAQKMAEATARGIAQVAGLRKKQQTVENFPLPALKRGEKSETVRGMQALLQLRGFPCGSQGTDGSFGGNTQRALRSFQQAKGLVADGVCGAESWMALLEVSQI